MDAQNDCPSAGTACTSMYAAFAGQCKNDAAYNTNGGWQCCTDTTVAGNACEEDYMCLAGGACVEDNLSTAFKEGTTGRTCAVDYLCCGTPNTDTGTSTGSCPAASMCQGYTSSDDYPCQSDDLTVMDGKCNDNQQCCDPSTGVQVVLCLGV